MARWSTNLAIHNDVFENSLESAESIGTRLKNKAKILSPVDAESLVSLIEAQNENLSDDLSTRALHIVAAGRCAEHWGCSVRKGTRRPSKPGK